MRRASVVRVALRGQAIGHVLRDHGLVSVTWDLGNPDSNLRRFLDHRLPNRHLAIESWPSQIHASDRRAAVLPERWHGRVGTALELRIALDLGARPPHWGKLAYLPTDQCQQLLEAAGFAAAENVYSATATSDPLLRTWDRSTRPHGEIDKCQEIALGACLTIAAAHDLQRKLSGEDWTVEARRNFPLVLGEHLGQSIHVEAFGGLRTAWDAYLAEGRAALLALGEAIVVAPEIANNYGTADLVVGRTLVDVKVYLDPLPHLNGWLDQLLTYALLDRYSFLKLQHVTIYLGWQARLLSIDLSAVIGATPASADDRLYYLRQQLAHDLADDLEFARARREADHHHIHLVRSR